MAAILSKMVYCYGRLLSLVFPNDFHYLRVCDSPYIAKNFHFIHVLKSKMASDFKMAAILPEKGMPLCTYILLLRFSS